MAQRWMTLVGLVFLIAVTAVAFVDYEITRKDADDARIDAAVARVTCRTSGGIPGGIARRQRRNALCEKLPGPLRVQDRVERRWDRRGPWYGFVAAAIFLPTAAMLVHSKRRRAISPTRDPSLSRPWRTATIAVRLAVGFTTWAALVYLVVDRWDELVEATGGSTHDCHYPENDCGVLGEFAEAHPLILLSLIVAAAAIPAAAIVWLLGRLFRSLDDQPASATYLPRTTSQPPV
jgi:hypothetical protein